jgi:hypothetical protein
MIVSIPDTITHQELERKLILKNTYGQVLNHKLKAIIARELVPFFLTLQYSITPGPRLSKTFGNL